MKAVIWPCLGTLLLTLLAACGDSGTTATTASTQISYAGSTDPAILTQSNSATLLAGAFQGGQSGNALGGVAALTKLGPTPRHPRTLTLSQTLMQAIRHADLDALPTPGAAATINNVSAQVAGTCGGQMSYTGTADDASRQFYATFTFNAYCEDAATITGTATVSGQTGVTTGFSSLSLAFDSLNIRSLGDSFTANGYEIITSQVGYINVSMNMLLQDDATKLVYRVKDFTLSIVDGAGSVSVSLSGRYYDPQYGHVDISTPAFLQINAGDYWPASGALKGTAYNSSATITALSNTSYQLDVDSSGDGATDYTASGLWAGL